MYAKSCTFPFRLSTSERLIGGEGSGTLVNQLRVLDSRLSPDSPTWTNVMQRETLAQALLSPPPQLAMKVSLYYSTTSMYSIALILPYSASRGQT